MNKSCYGCKFLFGDGDGYSDWTWLDTNVTCALDLNSELPKSECFDMSVEKMLEKLGGKCDRYSSGPYITISPDGEANDDFIDDEQEKAIRGARWMPDNEN